MKRRISLILVLLALATLAGAGVWTFGPREPVARSANPPAIGPGDPAAWLASQEADIPNLDPAAAKEIIWAYPASRARTPYAIVYVHGFSATKAELRPVPDMVAKALGANLYFTRLAGHGRNDAAMAEPTVGDWLDDLAEAVAIGRRIGDRVIVIGTSTGGALATYGASLPGVMDGVAGLVLVSPNYGVRDWRGFLLTMPYARQIVPAINGPDYGSAPASRAADEAAQTYGWTRRFPTVALLPMAALAAAAKAVDAQSIHVPALFLYNDGDMVVDSSAVPAMAARWGAPHQLLAIDDTADPSGHLLAGDLRSPATNARVADAIIQFIRGLD